MPYIGAKLSIKLDEVQKDNLQKELANAIAAAFSKPKSYIMTNIEDLYIFHHILDNSCL